MHNQSAKPPQYCMSLSFLLFVLVCNPDLFESNVRTRLTSYMISQVQLPIPIGIRNETTIKHLKGHEAWRGPPAN